ncbi:MAG: 2,3,4,5-tetrahydropyridine-2,6-dicarboxylate N-succinyltransferase, partial [Alteromonadales bacterium]|nr:2,3,4,5-tetrahydropyridine-2,6-dicarboxylate N-succinyltransferase [Alteromonadales bacterium]
MSTFALAFGTATKNRDQKIIEAFFPNPLLNPSEDLVAVVGALVGYQGGNATLEVTTEVAEQLSAAFNGADETANADFATAAAKSAQPLVLTILANDEAPATVAEGYLKLQLISHRLVKPH